MGGTAGAAAEAVASRLLAAVEATRGRAPRERLEALAAERLSAFDEARAADPEAREEELAGSPEDAAGLSPFLAAGAAALAPLVADAFAAARSLGASPLLPEDEACLSLWAMLEAVLLAAVRRADPHPLAGRSRLAGRALEVMLAELSGLDGRGEAR